jgi:HAD superfamily 5'-nucleotidase-like hydrolase
MPVFVNRILNLKKIKAIGFDMDYTLVRYHTEKFEELSFLTAADKLVEIKGYPKSVKSLSFAPQLVIQGLVIDKKRGNLLKVSRFGKVKISYHGTKPIDFAKQQKIYRNRMIDLTHENYQSLDTCFSMSNGVLFAELVELKKNGADLPSFEQIADDVREMIDLAHRDGTLKNEVRKNIEKYIMPDPDVARLLERLKRYDKKLLVVTNSDYSYTELLMSHTINPYLKKHKDWKELFDVVVTLAKKPIFFFQRQDFLAIDTETGLMSNASGSVATGVYQGGNAEQLQADLGLEGDSILYLGDHIYGDVVTLKKTLNWRTALVLEPLAEEIESIHKSQDILENINSLMIKKEELESELNQLDLEKNELNSAEVKQEMNRVFSDIESTNSEISSLLDKYKTFFNPHWGELMRSGSEESRFADQVEKYACIYMSKVSDLLNYSPKTYFRPHKRILPHEIVMK